MHAWYAGSECFKHKRMAWCKVAPGVVPRGSQGVMLRGEESCLVLSQCITLSILVRQFLGYCSLSSVDFDLARELIYPVVERPRHLTCSAVQPA